MSEGQIVLARQLSELRASEEAFTQTLEQHLGMTPPGVYRDRLREHLAQTRAQAARLDTRLEQLGAQPSLLDRGASALQDLAARLVSLSLAPLALLRTSSPTDTLLRNARDLAASEAFEIAGYRALAELARALDDERTAALAAEALAEEEAMFAFIQEQIPVIAEMAVAARVPASERRRPPRPAGARGAKASAETKAPLRKAPKSPRGVAAANAVTPPARAKPSRPAAKAPSTARRAKPRAPQRPAGASGGSAGGTGARRRARATPRKAAEPTRGEVASMREAAREAQASPDGPGPELHVDAPWPDYDELAVADVLLRLERATETEAALVRLYEGANQAREAILHATEPR
jgi:ferritin-like metal-binding protein YciE